MGVKISASSAGGPQCGEMNVHIVSMGLSSRLSRCLISDAPGRQVGPLADIS